MAEPTIRQTGARKLLAILGSHRPFRSTLGFWRCDGDHAFARWGKHGCKERAAAAEQFLRIASRDDLDYALGAELISLEEYEEAILVRKAAETIPQPVVQARVSVLAAVPAGGDAR